MEHIAPTLLEENSLSNVVLATVTLCLLLGFMLLLRKGVYHRLVCWAKKTPSLWDDLVVDMLEATNVVLVVFIALCISSRMLSLKEGTSQAISNILLICILAQIGAWGQRGIKTWLAQRRNQALELNEGHTTTHLGLLAVLATFLLWSTLFLLVLSNLGFNITALLTSLGIGGVAMALAVQNILSDVFASLSISIDKPFLVGDFIVVNDVMGTVKQVGLKTTRLQSVTGEEVVIANSELLKSQIKNYKRMTERRAIFGFGIRKDTSAQLLEKVRSIAKELIDSKSMARFEWAHFRTIGQHSLEFEIAYFMLTPNYAAYLNTQNDINLELVRLLQSEGIRFSLPTDRVDS